MGKAAALAVAREGGRALLVSRDAAKLERAKEQILDACEGADVATAGAERRSTRRVADG